MIGEMLSHAMSGIGDDLIASADESKVRAHCIRRHAKKRRMTLLAALAAVVCVIIASAIFAAGYMAGVGDRPEAGSSPNLGADEKAEVGQEIHDWRGLKVTSGLYSELTRELPEDDGSGMTESSGISEAIPILILTQSTDAREKAEAALADAGIAFSDGREIRVSLTPVQLAALEGEWTRECIFDLAK